MDVGHQVPMAVGRMERADLGDTAQPLDDLRRRFARHLDQHDRPHRQIVIILADAHREAQQGAGLEQAIEPVLHRAARDPQGIGQLGQRGPPIGPQMRDDAPVEIVGDELGDSHAGGSTLLRMPD